jgi:hypothetical protein
VAVQGTSPDGNPFVDFARALVLNGHGCLVGLSTSVKLGERLVVRNDASRQELDCCVVYLGDEHEGKTKVGLAFKTAAPQFWGLEYLSASWTKALN